MKSHEQKHRNRKVVVVVAEQAASEQSRIITTATGMVGRILTAAAAQISERSPTPHVGAVPGSPASVAGRPRAPEARCRYLDPPAEKEGAPRVRDGSAPAPCAESPLGPVTRGSAGNGRGAHPTFRRRGTFLRMGDRRGHRVSDRLPAGQMTVTLDGTSESPGSSAKRARFREGSAIAVRRAGREGPGLRVDGRGRSERCQESE